jgi:RNA polymerase sigma-70 factor (ECF subfamily)
MNVDQLNGLLDRVRQGDESASEQLVAAYEPYLRQVVRRSLPESVQGRFDSIDVVQSVWVHVLTGLRAGNWHFPDEGRLRAFLLQVARRRLISRVRHHLFAVQREAGSANLDALPGRGQTRPSEVVQAEELWQQMLDLCPPDHHAILFLRRQGLPLEEIARRTGLHEGSVRRILRRLARQLTLQKEPLARCSCTHQP